MCERGRERQRERKRLNVATLANMQRLNEALSVRRRAGRVVMFSFTKHTTLIRAGAYTTQHTHSTDTHNTIQNGIALNKSSNLFAVLLCLVLHLLDV